MFAIRVFLILCLLAIAAAAAPARSAMPLRGSLPGATQELAVRVAPAPLAAHEVGSPAR